MIKGVISILFIFIIVINIVVSKRRIIIIIKYILKRDTNGDFYFGGDIFYKKNIKSSSLDKDPLNNFI